MTVCFCCSDGSLLVLFRLHFFYPVVFSVSRLLAAIRSFQGEVSRDGFQRIINQFAASVLLC